MIVTVVAIPIAITTASRRRVRSAGRRNKVTCIRRKNAAFCCYKRYAGGADGASRPPLFSAGRGGRIASGGSRGGDRPRRVDRLVGRIARVRHPDRSRDRPTPGGLLGVLAGVAATDGHTAVAAVVTFALAYTCELGLSLVTYFGSGE